MRRRDFVAALGGAAAWPLAVHAQQPKRMRCVGALMPQAANDPQVQERNAAFLQGLQQLGWTVGQNPQIDYRWAGGNEDDTRKYAAELVDHRWQGADWVSIQGRHVISRATPKTRLVSGSNHSSL